MPTLAHVTVVSASLIALTACGSRTSLDGAGGSAPSANPPVGQVAHPINHVVVVMQSGRSFDSYFGTFPGTDGLPTKDGKLTTCVPDATTTKCAAPYHDPSDRNAGGPEGHSNAIADMHGGAMDGFINQARQAKSGCADPLDPSCKGGDGIDVMGYHDDRELSGYWAYAKNFVLQDHMFASSASWSLPSRLFLVSGWSAKCVADLGNTTPAIGQKTQCTADIDTPEVGTATGPAAYAWTDLTYLLHKKGVSWRYYAGNGAPYAWSPLVSFDTVREDGELGNVQSIDQFFTDAQKGNLPAVTWIAPNLESSEHPPALVSVGQAYVTSLVNALMHAPTWSSTAIFITWDGGGGFYDHVMPPTADASGYGMRVPGIVISPYAKKGFVDHQPLSFDAYTKYIEDLFLDGERLDPKTDGRPDARPNVRENVSGLGDLSADFDLTAPPRPPLYLAPGAAD